jgi:hypothetical protein
MARLETPVGILITVALLALCGAYSAWIGVTEHSVPFALLGAVALVAAVGVAMLKAWSRYLVYLLTAALIGTWSYSLYASAVAGYFELYTASQLAAQLGPGIFMIILSCFCTYAVFKQFRAAPRPPAS